MSFGLLWSGDTQNRYSWGKVTVARSGGAVSTIDIEVSNIADLQIIDADVPKKYFYVAISPTEELRLDVSNVRTELFQIQSKENVFTYTLGKDSALLTAAPTDLQLKELTSSIPSVPSISVAGYEWYRGYYLAKIELSPLVKNSKDNSLRYIAGVRLTVQRKALRGTTVAAIPRPKKDPYFEEQLKEMILNYEEAIPYSIKNTAADSTAWFDPTLKYLKLIIGRDGIYRLSYAVLDSIYPEILTVDPRSIKLFSNGKEYPLYVAGENDGVFHDTDYVEFPAQRNYTGNHRVISTGTTEYNEYLNRYSDSTVLWLTYSPGNGSRMMENGVAESTAETLQTYTDFRHFEQNVFLQYTNSDQVLQQNPLWTSHDVWGWRFLAANQEMKQTFSVTDVVAGDTGKVYAKYVSWGASISAKAHVLGIRVGKGSVSGKDLDQDTINRYEHKISSSVFLDSSLQNGTNNISIFSYPTASTSVNWIIPDWLEIEIPRKIKAISDSLSFEFRKVTTTALRTVVLSNLTKKNILIYKIRPIPKRISQIIFSGTGPYTARFTDTVAVGDKYYLLPQTKVLTPTIVKKKQFIDIRGNASQADFVMVANVKFYNESLPYSTFLTETKKLKAKLIDVDDIFDEFGYGYQTPEAVQLFLQSTTIWPSPMPAYAMFIGDASYDYKFVYKNYSAKNYVPSYGYPVSDPMLVTWKSLSNYPQMFVGRLPVNNVGEVSEYLNRVMLYEIQPNTEWNKRYLLFSGGDPTVSGQIASFKETNDFVKKSYIDPAPIGGNSVHFYKTTSPQSDFGPYSPQEFKDAISAGSVFISYIGHSGTQTWDNSILDPAQLKNSAGRFPLVTDFGCSTGKFAEPQIVSFSELFVVGPQSYAIGYIGNSALGFTSIASTLPKEFYKKILQDSIVGIGKAHLLSKIQLAQGNFSSVNQVMLYTNSLIGDPSVELRVPFSPDIAINDAGIESPGTHTDKEMNATVKLQLRNYGSTTMDSVDIRILHRYNNTTIENIILKKPMPLNADTIVFSAYIRGMAGEHSIIITIDSLNNIPEINEANNRAEKIITVLSTDIKILSPNERNTAAVSKVVFLNPAVLPDTGSIVYFEIDTSAEFTNSKAFTTAADKFSSVFDVSTLDKGRRYWWRIKIASPSAQWNYGTYYSGVTTGTELGIADSLGFSALNNTNLSFFQNTLKVSNDPLTLRAISAGYLAGSAVSIEMNGVNILPNTFVRSFSLAHINPISLSIISIKQFDTYGTPALMDSLAVFIDSIPSGDILISVVADAVSTGGSLKTSVQNAYASIGAVYQSTYSYQGSWAVIGKKGGAPGSALEAYFPASASKAIVETTYTRTFTSGRSILPILGPAASWGKVTTNRTIPIGTSIVTSVVGIHTNASEDTIAASNDSTISLNAVSSDIPFIKLVYDFKVNSEYLSPELHTVEVQYSPLTELGTYSKTFTGYHVKEDNTLKEISANDTIVQGEKLEFHYRIYNAGRTTVKNVPFALICTWDNNYVETMATQVIDSIQSDSYQEISTQYSTLLGSGRRDIRLMIDPDSTIREFYRDNNTFTYSYFIKKSPGNPLQPNLVITQNAVTISPAQVSVNTDTAWCTIVYANTGSLVNDSISIQIKHYYNADLLSTEIVRRKYPVAYDTFTVAIPILKNSGEHQLSVDIDYNGLISESSESDNFSTFYFTVVTTDFNVIFPAPNSISYVDRIIFLNPTLDAGSNPMIQLEVDTVSNFSTKQAQIKQFEQFATTFLLPGLNKQQRYYWRVKIQNSGRDWSTGSFYSGDSSSSAFGQLDPVAWNQNIFNHIVFSADSGARIVDTKFIIKARSAGFSDGNMGALEVNGMNLLTPILGSGHNITVLDTVHFGVVSQRRFNITADPNEADSLTQFITSIQNGLVVVDVVVDEGANNLQPTTRNALKTIGSAYIDQLAFRDSWTIIGRKGAAPGTVPEMYRPQNSGSALAETTVVQIERIGTIETPVLGPFNSLYQLQLESSIPSGAEVKTQFIGKSSKNSFDTLLTVLNQNTISLGAINTKLYRSGKLLFTLAVPSILKNRQTVASVNSPAIKSWKISATSSTELAVSRQSSVIDRDQVMEGENIQFTGKVYNVSTIQAESVLVQLRSSTAGIDYVVLEKFLRVPAHDSADVSVSYDTRGRKGNHAFTFEIDPRDSLSEQTKSNNVVTIPFVVLADSTRPLLQVTIDGLQVVNGDYIGQHPDIRISYTDDNPTGIVQSDTSNFRIELNNDAVPFEPGIAEMINTNAPGRADIRWTPELKSGENVFRIYAKDVAQNYSDTILIYVNVASEFRILDLYNIPNPFSNSTHFTFNLAGPSNPDEVMIKIYTVAGRLIQELNIHAIIGFNRIPWDGRDKDGDQIGNGVYFYKLIVKHENKQIEGLSKLVKMR
ncbi:MAG: C25 family cysteine peptidase [Bacteroidota bacterium]